MAFFCFTKKLPWSKTTRYNCNDVKDKHATKTSKAGAVDEDYGPYQSTDSNHLISSNGMYRNGNRLDKYGIDIALDGSLRRSKKKKKKIQKGKSKTVDKEDKQTEEKDDRAMLPRMLNNATEDLPVKIVTSLVDDFGPTKNCPFKANVGDKVIALYRKGDFVFVKRFDGVTGFVPVQICFLVGRFVSSGSFENLSAIGSNVDANGSVVNEEQPSSVQRDWKASLEDSTDSSFDRVDKDETKTDAPSQMEPKKIVDTEDNECDSLARKVQRHEMRQLLKNDIKQKMVLSNDQTVNKSKNGSQVSLKNSKLSLTKIEHLAANASQENIDDLKEYEADTATVQKDEVKASSSIKNLSGSSPLKERSASIKNNSKLSLNGKTGSQHSLNSLKSKKAAQIAMLEEKKVQQNKLYQHVLREKPLLQNSIQRNGSLDSGSQRSLNSRTRSDNLSLSSYDGSIQEIYSRLNGNMNPYFPNPDYFYHNDIPDRIIESRIHDLLNETQFIRNRRCSSLRKAAHHGVFPKNHFIGHGHGYSPRLADDERSWKIFAESFSAPGSRVMSPTEFGYLYSQQNGHPEMNMDLGDRFMFALQDFKSLEKDDIDLRKGERVFVVRNDSESWWWVRNNRGEEGFVPSHFLIPLLKPANLDIGSPTDFAGRNGISRFPDRRRGQDEMINKAEWLANRITRHQSPSDQEGQLLAKLVRSNTIGSEGRGKRGVKIDWTKFYNTGKGHAGLNGPIGVNMSQGEDDVQSKEALLRKIRGEVEQDPMKVKVRINGRVPSNESIHKITARSTDAGGKYNDRNQGRILVNGSLYPVNRNDAKRPEENLHASRNVCHMSVEADLKDRPMLPSYEQCVEKINKIEAEDQTVNGDTAEDSGLFETPRVLRRRRTYSGASNNKKVRFNQGECDPSDSNKVREGENKIQQDENGKGITGALDSLDAGFQTWC